MGAIDRSAVLEILGIKDRKQIIERMGETQLDQALQVMIDAGLPEEEAIQLKQFLLQPQTGQGQGGAMSQPQPGTPVAHQGGM